MALVRPTLVTLGEVDLGLKTKLTGISVTLLTGGSTVVPVIMEEQVPPVHESYPRITIELIGENEAFENFEASDDYYEAGYDDTQDPPEFSMNTVPECVKLIYQIKGWVKNDTAAARELYEKMRIILGRRTYMTIPKVDPADIVRELWMLQEGTTVFLKESENDELILQTVWTYGIFAELARTSTSQTEKAVKQITWDLYQGVSDDNTENELFRRFTYDDDSFTPQ
jgi:hypothetical protein